MNVPGDFRRSDRMLLQASAGLLMLTPILMVASREVPPTILVIATVLLMVAAYRARSMRAVLVDLASTLCTPAGLVFGGLVLLMASSLMWSPVAERGANHALHFAGGVVLGAIAIATSLRLRPGFNAFIFALILSIAAIIVAMDMWLSGALREGLSLSTRASRLNRAAVAITLLLPLATVLLLMERRLVLLVVLWIAAALAVLLSASYSAKLAFGLFLLILPLTLVAPNLLHRASMIVLPLITLSMPWIASVANALVPGRIHDAVGYGSLTIRGEIWRETFPFIWEKPYFGWGIEASHALARLPEAAHLTDVQRGLLDWGHTHNAPLQVWLELGMVGAALAAAALYFGLRAMRVLPPALLPYAMTTVVAAFAIACVSHGAWQAWWWALLGLIAAAYAMAIATYLPEAIRPKVSPTVDASA
ncbi:MAG: O-antigen ligase family protein [Salinarimonas sp.]|nr:O-antigen ligase family protein [Salinarimonas sp.]